MLATYARLLGLLDRQERRQVAGLMVLILVLGFLELAGVASILPFLAVLSDPDLVRTNPWLAGIHDALGFAGTDGFLFFLGLCTVTLVVAGQAVKAVTIYLITRFSCYRELTLSQRLLSRYLHQPYVWFLERHSAELGARVLNEVGKVVHGALIPALRLVVQVTVTATIVILLFLVDPTVAAATVIVIGGTYGIIAVLARRYLRRLGDDRLAANAEAWRATHEAFGGIKDVKLLGIEDAYLERYRDPAARLARRTAAFTVVSEMPRYVLEAIVFGGMVLLLILMLRSGGGGLGAVIPTVGLFAFAGARLFPAIQQVYSCVSSIRFSAPALDRLVQDLDGEAPSPPGPAERIPFAERIELRDVVFRYPTGTRASLERLSLSIPANSTVGIVGPSGAGKTTLVDVILGLLVPQSGALVVDGVTVTPDRLPGWQRQLGYVPQEIFLTDDTLAANIALGIPPNRIDMAAVERAARAAELHDFVGSDLPQGYLTALGERGVRLSGGQRQRVGIAARSTATPRFWCWTRRPVRSIPRPSAP